MNFMESETVELKSEIVPDICKEVIAFANTQGGTIYIGVRDDGTVVGIDNLDAAQLRLNNMIRDAIKPDVTMFVRYEASMAEGKQILAVTVQKGTDRPYYLGSKGLKPSGVYVRRGSSSQPLSDEGIREMIVENSGKSYEKCRSMNQNLTFHAFEEEMKKRGLEFGLVQMRTLHMVNDEELYTNLALLLSDQCEHSIKLAVYQGRDKSIFRDRKEFSGSLLKQMKDAFESIQFYNKTKATFHGLERNDKLDYPMEAIRETLLNCIVHRDYSFSGSTLINLYDDRIEFISLGGLVPGISLEAVFMGVSQTRNVNLAAIFYRMKLIESYGTGIGKICELYSNEVKQPQFDTAKGVFRVILPNCNEGQKGAGYYGRNNHDMGVTITPIMRTQEEQKARILQYASQVSVFRRKDIEELLDLKTTSVFNLLRDLCNEHKIRSVGKGKNSYYEYVS